MTEPFRGTIDQPVLLGGCCTECNATVFPYQEGCPRCTGHEMTLTELPSTGSLWSWTVQRFEPKTPYRGAVLAAPFEPFGVGLVDLGSVIVQTRLTTADQDRLRIGGQVRLTLVPVVPGDERLTFAFAPEGD